MYGRILKRGKAKFRRNSGRDMNPGLPQCEGMQPTGQRYTVIMPLRQLACEYINLLLIQSFRGPYYFDMLDGMHAVSNPFSLQ
jgi:hypothetical protein